MMVMVVMEESLQDVPGKCMSKLRVGPREYPGYILEHMEEGNLPCDGLETSREQADVMLDSFICYTTTRRCPCGSKKKVQLSGHIGQAWKGEKRGGGRPVSCSRRAQDMESLVRFLWRRGRYILSSW